jgi:hypothetical protein
MYRWTTGFLAAERKPAAVKMNGQQASRAFAAASASCSSGDPAGAAERPLPVCLAGPESLLDHVRDLVR